MEKNQIQIRFTLSMYQRTNFVLLSIKVERVGGCCFVVQTFFFFSKNKSYKDFQNNKEEWSNEAQEGDKAKSKEICRRWLFI